MILDFADFPASVWCRPEVGLALVSSLWSPALVWVGGKPWRRTLAESSVAAVDREGWGGIAIPGALSRGGTREADEGGPARR